MKKIVDPRTATQEGSPQSGTNHPWKVVLLGDKNQPVQQACAAGFVAALKEAPKAIDGSRVKRVAILGSSYGIPFKYGRRFQNIQIGAETHHGFLVTA